MLSQLLKAITMASVCLSLALPNISFAGSVSASNQATATLAAECTISAQDLAFGNLVLPLSAQSASSSMTVLCSKNHAYTIGLAYGGAYGKGSVTVATEPDGYDYGTKQYICSYSANGVSGTFEQSSIMCPGSYTVGVSYTYGKMIGVSSGDSIGYSIQVPGSPSKVWNTGESSYADTGTGVSQTIPVVGTLVPAQSSSTYPTPDYYMDTVTATVNF